MPTMDVDYAEFERMLGIELHGDLEKIGDVLALAKGEVKLFDAKEGMMSIEIKDTNRPDLWNVEGLVRTLRGFLCLDVGLRQYAVGKPLAEIYVDRRLKQIRPYIGCSIVKDVKLTDPVIRGLMQLQDKLDHTYGRNRRRTSIGLYDFNLIASPLHYTVAKPTEISFVPLGLEKKMNLKEILRQHPKGIEYGAIVNKYAVYPILYDTEKKVLSFPPIINSSDLGRVTEETRNVLVEVTGTNWETVQNTLKIVTLSLIDRGGKAYSAKVHYELENVTEITPNFEAGHVDLDIEYVNKVLGLKLTADQIAELLEKACFGIERLGREKIAVQIPCYRIDVMHQIDLVEEVAIAYGYDNIKAQWRKLPTTGGVRPEQSLLNVARELMVGLGFQEILTYNMTNLEALFTKMNLRKRRIIEIANPKVQTLTCLRSWLLPSLMEFLAGNLHVEYPQKIFELDKVTALNKKMETRTRDEEKLAAAVSHATGSFTEVKSDLDALFMNLGLEWQLKKTRHPSFIDGRAGIAVIDGKEAGILGEISPKVLEAWGIENPTAAFELNMRRIVETKNNQDCARGDD